MNYLLHVHAIYCNSILPYYFGGDCEMSPFSTMLDPKFLPVHRIDPSSHRSLHLSPVAQRRHDSRKATAYSLGTFEKRETWGCTRFLCFCFCCFCWIVLQKLANWGVICGGSLEDFLDSLLFAGTLVTINVTRSLKQTCSLIFFQIKTVFSPLFVLNVYSRSQKPWKDDTPTNLPNTMVPFLKNNTKQATPYLTCTSRV